MVASTCAYTKFFSNLETIFPLAFSTIAANFFISSLIEPNKMYAVAVILRFFN